jgi:Sortilin, neurotensin receptor 3,
MMAAMRRVAAVALTLALMSIMGPQASAQGDDDQGGGPDWVDTPLTSPTSRLFTPRSGALLALTSDALIRSDDAGDSWYAVDTQGRHVVYVDPTNQDVLYATSNADPLLQSTGGGADWTKLLSGPPYQGKQLDAFAVSAADTNVMYAGLKQGSISDQYWLYRSRDGGTTWTQLFHAQYSLCGWGVPVLMPHPTDASRLFFSGGCHAGRDFSETLQQSVDYGQSFTDIYVDRDAAYDALSGYPQALVGGTGAEPSAGTCESIATSVSAAPSSCRAMTTAAPGIPS